MKKKIAVYCIFLSIVIVMTTIIFVNMHCRDRESVSRLNHNERTILVTSDLEAQYGHTFKLASRETEKKIYGIWQADDIIGYDNTARYQGDGLRGSIVVFYEDAFIYSGTSWHKPVFAYYQELIEDMSSDPFLNLTCLEDMTAKSIGTVIVVLNAEPNRKYGSAFSDEQLKLIIIDDVLIMESQSSYFKLTKIGEVKMY